MNFLKARVYEIASAFSVRAGMIQMDGGNAAGRLNFSGMNGRGLLYAVRISRKVLQELTEKAEWHKMKVKISLLK